MSDTSTGRLVAAEFAGTTIVMIGGPGLIVLGSGSIGPLGVALGFGISIAIAIGVIGAVANPMFSLALWFSRGIATRELFSDWVGQFLGGIFGAALIFGLNDTTRFTRGVNGWDRSGYGELGVVLGGELLLGTIVVVVLLSAISQQRSNSAMAAFTGAAYALGTLLLLDISGAGLNPARSLGAAAFADTDPNALGQVWAFVVVPIVAAFVGTIVWLVIDDATIDDTVFDDTVLEDIVDAVTGDDD
jgi:aquaporin Z